jgi:chromosome segregation ATPase
MQSVSESKQELEASIRYAENAISSAKATIESMEFRQQAASKAWHEQTGRESALEYAVNDLKKKLEVMTDKYDKMKGYADQLLDENGELEERNGELKTQLVEWRDRSMGYTKEIGELKSELDELSKAYKDSTHEEITMKKAWREQRELVALRDDQIAMLERRLAKKENPYPFKEGDLYYVFNQLDGTWIESVWDDESERIHDSRSLPDHPHKVYFTVDQKNVLDKFKPEDD